MEVSETKRKVARLLVVVGWILLVISSLSIGRFDGTTERAPAVAAFLANPSWETFDPFFGWMFAVLLGTFPGGFLGLVAWSLADLRSAKLLAIVGLGVVAFAIIYNVLP